MDCLFRIPVTGCKGRVLRRNGYVQSWCWVFLLATADKLLCIVSWKTTEKKKTYKARTGSIRASNVYYIQQDIFKRASPVQ